MKKGFSLIEVLVAAALTGVGVAALLGGLSALSQGQTRLLQRQTADRLLDAKLSEVIATQEFRSSAEGNFLLEGQPDFTWTSSVDQTGTEGLEYVEVTVTKQDSELEVRGGQLVYTPPVTDEAAPAGGTP